MYVFLGGEVLFCFVFACEIPSFLKYNMQMWNRLKSTGLKKRIREPFGDQ